MKKLINLSYDLQIHVFPFSDSFIVYLTIMFYFKLILLWIFISFYVTQLSFSILYCLPQFLYILGNIFMLFCLQEQRLFPFLQLDELYYKFRDTSITYALLFFLNYLKKSFKSSLFHKTLIRERLFIALDSRKIWVSVRTQRQHMLPSC